MGEKTKISWCDHTFSPWRGCTRLSAACKFCYAAEQAHRWGKDIWGDDKPREMASESYWRQPRTWNKKAQAAGERRRVFCASLADVFEDRPELVEPRRRLFDLIRATPQLDWLLLTKRPENMQSFAMRDGGWYDAWPENVWAGATAEDQGNLEARARWLVHVRARVRFLSMEPLLNTVTMPDWVREQVQWVICGGESGSHARPFEVREARRLLAQCRDAKIAFFMKQMGARPTGLLLSGKSPAGSDPSEWPEDLRVQEWPR